MERNREIVTKVTFVDESKLNYKGIEVVRKGGTPKEEHFLNKVLFDRSEVLIFRLSDLFMSRHRIKEYTPLVVKTKY